MNDLPHHQCRRAGERDDRAQPAPDLPDHRRADARHAAGRARPDHRGHRAADDRRRPRRAGSHIAWVVTAYLLATTVSTPLWGKLGDQYGRKIFFQAAIVIFLIGSVAVRPQPLHGRAHRVPRDPGPRRRRADGRRAGHRGRHRLAPRARPYHGPVRRGLRRLQRHRPAARRRLRGQPDLALDLLHQPADRHHRARRGGQPGAGRAEPGAPRHRLPRHRCCCRPPRPRSSCSPAWAAPPIRGRPRPSTSSAWRASCWSACSCWSSGAPRSRSCRCTCSGIARFSVDQHRRLHRRLRDVRRDHLPARVLPGRPGHLPHHLRACTCSR